MKEKQPLSKRLKEIGGKVADYLKGNPENWPEELRQVEFYAGVPIDEVLRILATVAGVVGGSTAVGIGIWKSLGRVRAGYEGIRVTFGRPTGKPIRPGPYLTDPFRTFQQVVEIDKSPQHINIPGGVTGFAQDGTRITADMMATGEVGNSEDLVRIIHPKEVLIPAEEPKIVEIVGDFGDIGARRVIAGLLPSVDGLRDEKILGAMDIVSQRLLQETIDKIFLDEKGRKEVREKTAQGIDRRDIRKGFIITKVGYPNLVPSEGVVEAMQEQVEAPRRLDAEKTLQEGLGKNYTDVRRTMGIEEIARKGGGKVTLVVGLGGGREETYLGGTLGEIKNLKEGIGETQTIEKIRDYIDELRGEGG